MKRTWMGWAVVAMGVMAAAASGQEASPVSAALDVPVLSSYVWRGQTLSDRPVIQPGLTVAKNGFSLNAWSSFNLDGPYQADFSEVDLTASYSQSVGPVTLGGGMIQYLFPNQTLAVEDGEDTAVAGTAEVFASASLPEVPLAPALTVYYDVDEIDGFYGTLAVGHTFELTEKIGLAVSASLAAADGDYNAGYFGVDEAALNDGNVGLSLPVAVLDNLTLKPAVNYIFFPDSEIRDGAEAVYGEKDRWVGSLVASYSF